MISQLAKVDEQKMEEQEKITLSLLLILCVTYCSFSLSF